MFGLGTTELVIILAIALVIFGGKKLRSLGGDVGGAISEFKSSLNSDDEEEEKPAEPANAAPATSAENSEVSTEQ